MSSTGLTITLTGREQQLLSALAAVERKLGSQEAKLQKLQQEGRRAGDEIKDAGDKGSKSLGQMGNLAERSVASLGVMVSGWASVAGAIKLATDEFQRHERIKAEAAINVQAAAFDRGALQTLSLTDPAKYDQLRSLADVVQTTAGVDADEAARMAFKFESAGVAGDAEFLASLRALGSAADPLRLSGAVGKYRSAFAGGDTTGGTEEIVSKALLAAGPIADVDPTTFLQATLPSIASAKMLGLTDEESMAALQAVAGTAKSIDAAGTQVAALYRDLVKQGFADDMRGATLAQMLTKVRGQGMSNEELGKFLSDEGLRAFAAIEPDQLAATAFGLDQAAITNLARHTVSAALDDRDVSAPLELTQEQQKLNQTYEDRGRLRTERDILHERLERFDAERGEQEMQSWLQRNLWRLLPESLQVNLLGTQASIEEARREGLEAIRQQREAAENMNRAAENLKDAADRQGNKTLGSPFVDR